MRITLSRTRKSKLRTSHNIPSSEIQPEISLCEEYKGDVDPVPKRGLEIGGGNASNALQGELDRDFLETGKNC